MTQNGTDADVTTSASRTGEACFEDLLYLTERPIFIRFHLQVDGKPWNETRRQLAVQHFKRLDRDRDGLISLDQLGEVPLPGFTPDDVTTWDTQTQDGKLSQVEFLHLLDNAGEPAFLLAEGATRATRQIKLFPLLDVNQDRRLTADEIKQARAILYRLDYDDDETVSTTELAPFTNPLVPQLSTAREKPLSVEAPFIAASTFASPADLAKVLLRRYGKREETESAESNQTEPASCRIENLGTAAVDASVYDLDVDGRLNLQEMTSFIEKHRPDLEILVDLVCNKPIRPKLRVLSASKLKHQNEDGRASNRLALTVEKTGLDLRVQGSRVQSRDNRTFYLLQFRVADQNKNSYLEADEFPRVGLNTAFGSVDTDGDGKVVRDELIGFLHRDAFASQSQVVLSIAADSRTLFEVMDLNYDQRLAMREFAGLPARIKLLDVNRDNVLDANEMAQQYRLVFSLGKPRVFQQQMAAQRNAGVPAPRATPTTDGPAWFRKMDRNQDGDLSWREFLGTRQVFDRLDLDHDGLITVKELAAAKSADTEK